MGSHHPYTCCLLQPFLPSSLPLLLLGTKTLLQSLDSGPQTWIHSGNRAEWGLALSLQCVHPGRLWSPRWDARLTGCPSVLPLGPTLLLLLSRFGRVQLCATPETAAHQAPLSLGFSRQEYWSGLPFPSPNVCMHAKSLQSCPTLCDPMDSSPSGSSVHRILQARILEWVAISFSHVCLRE